MQTKQPTRLRGHHLRVLGIILKKSREEYANILIKEEYVTDAQHPFVGIVYDKLRNIFSNPQSKLTIIAEEHDFICDACPIKNDHVNCTDAQVASILSPGFLAPEDLKDYPKNTDVYPANKYGLEIGQTYTAEEILRKMNI